MILSDQYRVAEHGSIVADVQRMSEVVLRGADHAGVQTAAVTSTVIVCRRRRRRPQTPNRLRRRSHTGTSAVLAGFQQLLKFVILHIHNIPPSMDHEHGTVCQPILEHQIRPSVPSSVISRPTCFSSSLRCWLQVGSAPFVRRRCDCLVSSAPFTNIQTY